MNAKGLPGIRRIAVLRPNHRLGNTLLLTPLVKQLGDAFPHATVDVVTGGHSGFDVFRGFSNVSDIIGFPKRACRHPVRTAETFRRLLSRRYDLAIDPMIRSRSGRFLLNTLRSTHKLGYSSGSALRDRALTFVADSGTAPRSYAEIPVYLLHRFMAAEDNDPSAAARLHLSLSAAERERGHAFLNPVDPSAPTMTVFANATGGKCFTPEWWKSVIGWVRRELPRLNVIEFVPDDGRPRLSDVAAGRFTRDLRLLGGALSAANLVACADCGIMHLADASNARLLGLFKTTDPGIYGPRNPNASWLVAHDSDPAAVGARISATLLSQH